MSLKRTKTRPNKRQYEDLDDSRDTRVPLHNDEAFMHGLSFTAKFIGSLEVSKPSSRVEIVSCMRRIRYEFRAKSMKKTKATINVSVSGVKVTKYVKKKRKRQRKRTPEDLVANPQVILESPIYRIFYVSHDSLDKKIFSFIARVEAAGNRKTFVCAVFKAYKKSHALRIVRTIGQAFDICCKLQQSTDAVNIPGLLPPEKLKKLKEKKDGDEGTSVDDTDGEPTRRERLSTSPGDMLNNFNLDMSVVEATELPPNAIVTMEDDYETNLLEYQKHLYAFGQSLLLNSADVQQSTNEEALLDGYKLSPAQRQLMILQFKLKQEQGLANAFMPAGSTQANVSSNGADAVLSKPLPTPPPNRLKVGSKGKFARPGVGVTENTNRDDSALLPRVAEEGAAAAAAGNDSVPTDMLVDTSIPEEPSNPVNPFTSTLLEDDDRPMPQTDAQWVEMQKAQTAQLQLLKDQLSAETASRIDAQANTHHVMRQNKILAAYIMHIGTQLKRYKASQSDDPTGAASAATGAGGSRVVTTEVFSPPPATHKTTLYERTPEADSTQPALAAAGAADKTTVPAISIAPPVQQQSVSTSSAASTAPASSASADKPSEMEMLSEILAASKMQSSTADEDFQPRQGEQAVATAAVGNGTQHGRFSPFSFDPNEASTSTPSGKVPESNGNGGDGRFSPFEGFKASADTNAVSGGGRAGHNVAPGNDAMTPKPVVLFELPEAPTPLSDLDLDEDEPLYPNDGPAYVPLQDITMATDSAL
ncbi:dystrophin-like protein 1 [Sycon ciliatum]|uniref:dystrophin-like protein 1 n=1 Tax=Sycon ciliatum TaxID=27933 RepID=UPI0031F68438